MTKPKVWDVVYIVPLAGQRYHRRWWCVARWRTRETVTKREAVRLGMTACRLCYPGGDR